MFLVCVFRNPTPHDEPIRDGVWLPSGKDGRQIDLGNKEFKMHGRLLHPLIEKLASIYTFILPSLTACINHA